MKRLVPLKKIKTNEINPRYIKQDKYLQLVESIKEFPEMLEKRPIVVDETGTILGGNMRLKACEHAGLKEVWCEIVTDWSEEQKKQFIIKDNVTFGQWEWDILANQWEIDDLKEWGLDVVNMQDSFEDDTFEESQKEQKTGEVEIVMSMSKQDYSNAEDDFQSLIKKHSNIICRIKN
tara:strand:+ start:529 stop:1059 length:531 start_codon:yes stop_codon:yes gene_type:complete